MTTISKTAALKMASSHVSAPIRQSSTSAEQVRCALQRAACDIRISAHLIDAGRGDHAEEAALFCDSILKQFGSVEAAAAAKSAADAVFAKHEEWPADGATPADVSAYERWESAENAAHKAALAGWARVPDSAHFDVRFDVRFDLPALGRASIRSM